ncbi:MAG: hypothetical protein IID61_16365 [SAR324 cluster bacterium]|nr:hypothetical protein [SAR324 cluster bacterium]
MEPKSVASNLSAVRMPREIGLTEKPRGTRRAGGWLTVLIAACILVMAGCIDPDVGKPPSGESQNQGGGGDTGGNGGAVDCSPDCTITDDTATVSVGAAGGIVTFSPGGDTTHTVTLDIPAGALFADTTPPLNAQPRIPIRKAATWRPVPSTNSARTASPS